MTSTSSSSKRTKTTNEVESLLEHLTELFQSQAQKASAVKTIKSNMKKVAESTTWGPQLWNAVGKVDDEIDMLNSTPHCCTTRLRNQYDVLCTYYSIVKQNLTNITDAGTRSAQTLVPVFYPQMSTELTTLDTGDVNTSINKVCSYIRLCMYTWFTYFDLIQESPAVETLRDKKLFAIFDTSANKTIIETAIPDDPDKENIYQDLKLVTPALELMLLDIYTAITTTVDLPQKANLIVKFKNQIYTQINKQRTPNKKQTKDIPSVGIKELLDFRLQLAKYYNVKPVFDVVLMYAIIIDAVRFKVVSAGQSSPQQHASSSSAPVPRNDNQQGSAIGNETILTTFFMAYAEYGGSYSPYTSLLSDYVKALTNLTAQMLSCCDKRPDQKIVTTSTQHPPQNTTLLANMCRLDLHVRRTLFHTELETTPSIFDLTNWCFCQQLLETHYLHHPSSNWYQLAQNPTAPDAQEAVIIDALGFDDNAAATKCKTWFLTKTNAQTVRHPNFHCDSPTSRVDAEKTLLLNARVKSDFESYSPYLRSAPESEACYAALMSNRFFWLHHAHVYLPTTRELQTCAYALNLAQDSDKIMAEKQKYWVDTIHAYDKELRGLAFKIATFSNREKIVQDGLAKMNVQIAPLFWPNIPLDDLLKTYTVFNKVDRKATPISIILDTKNVKLGKERVNDILTLRELKNYFFQIRNPGGAEISAPPTFKERDEFTAMFHQNLKLYIDLHDIAANWKPTTDSTEMISESDTDRKEMEALIHQCTEVHRLSLERYAACAFLFYYYNAHLLQGEYIINLTSITATSQIQDALNQFKNRQLEPLDSISEQDLKRARTLINLYLILFLNVMTARAPNPFSHNSQTTSSSTGTTQQLNDDIEHTPFNILFTKPTKPQQHDVLSCASNAYFALSIFINKGILIPIHFSHLHMFYSCAVTKTL